MTRSLVLLLAAFVVQTVAAQVSPSALAFDDASGDRLVSPVRLDGPAFTLEAWVVAADRSDLSGFLPNSVFSTDAPGNHGDGFGVSAEYDAGAGRWYGRVVIEYRYGFETVLVPDIEPGQWHHYALTKAPGAAGMTDYQLVVDGAVVSSFSRASQTATAVPMRIGFHNDDGSYGPRRFHRGRIDEVRVWSVARSPAQIAAAMSQPLMADVPGLEAYYRFDEGSGQVAYDATGRFPVALGSGVAIEVEDPNWEGPGGPVPAAPDGGPSGLAFDGVDDWVEIPSSPALSPAEGTWSFWMRAGSVSGTYTMLMNRVDPYASTYGLTVAMYSDGRINAGAKTGDCCTFQVVEMPTGTTVLDGEWHHVAVTYGRTAGSTLALYVDGALVDEEVLTYDWSFTGQPLYLGESVDSFWSAYRGALDDVRIWDHARTAAQIAADAAQPIPADSDGLLALYRLDEGAGQTVYDATGRFPGRLGSASGADANDPAWVSGIGPVPAPAPSTTHALAFDGIDDYVTMGAVHDLLGQSFTAEAWFRTPVQTPRAVFFKHVPGSFNGYFLAVNQSGGYGAPGKAWCYSAGSEPTVAVSTTNVTDGEWHHVACVFDQTAGQKRIYVDGVLEGTGTIPSTQGNSAPFFVGGYDINGYRESFPGAVDEVRVWSTARTSEEIATDQYARLAGTEAGLLALYRFDDGSGQVVADAAGSAHGQRGSTNAADANDPAWIPPGVDLVGEVDALTLQLTGRKGWRTLAAAFPGTTYDDLLGPLFTRGYPGSDRPRSRKPSVFLYDETVDPTTDPADLDGYATPAAASEEVPVGRGLYAYTWTDQDRDGVNEGYPAILQTGVALAPPFVFDVTYTPTGDAMDGFNLLGNPFATALEWDKLVRSNVSPTVYVYDANHPGGPQYRTWTTGLGGTLADDRIAPNQGFWVQATGASPTLRAPRGSRTSTGPFYGLRADDEPTLALDLHLEGALVDTLYATTARVVLFDATTGAEALAKEGSISGAAKVASHAPSSLLLAAIADDALLDVAVARATGRVEVPLAVGAVFEGGAVPADLALTWPGLSLPVGWQVRLVDRATGAEVDLRETSRYAFSSRPMDLVAAPHTEAPEAPPLLRPLRVSPDRSVADARFVLVAEAVGHDVTPPISPSLVLAPNPAFTTARVRFAVGEAGPVRIVVHDALGREVAEIDAGDLPAGDHVVTLDTSRLAPGVYLVRLATDSGTFVDRLTVLR